MLGQSVYHAMRKWEEPLSRDLKTGKARGQARMFMKTQYLNHDLGDRGRHPKKINLLKTLPLLNLSIGYGEAGKYHAKMKVYPRMLLKLNDL